MTAETELPEVLATFTSATEAALQTLPSVESLLPPENGITLLDAKTEIFLAYLQALALRNLHVIRSIKEGSSSAEATQALSEEITKKLVGHRVYLERGVRPLEAKIKYQVDKVVKAADDQERGAAEKLKASVHNRDRNSREDGENSNDSDTGESDDELQQDALAYRPNRAAFAKAPTASSGDSVQRPKSKQDDVYRPPRISATAMPSAESTNEQKERRAPRSAVLEDYVATELADVPQAEPSIGSTIAAGGRRTMNAKQMREEAERREYEETNLVRLPKQAKKDRNGRDKERSRFGGEEWRGLGESVDRISESVKRRGGRETTLERSRKRKTSSVEDGPRDSGMGNAFELKRRRMEKKMARG